MKRFRNYFWNKGEPWNSVRSWMLPRILRTLHSLLMCTLRISASGVCRSTALMDEAGILYVTWHDLTLMPLHLFRDRNIGVMMSRSHSGQIQSAFWNMYGWPTVWGSTNKREGIRALREVLRLLRSGQSFAFTVDGPKGPRHHAHPGAIYLASNAPALLLPLGVAGSAYWQLPTWDRYFIPRPFSRVHVHIGEPLQLPTDIPRRETEYWQEQIATIINAASDEAQRRLQKS
jgi:lysophospholipid acyltransferase (LPLAT)-like uncharacterized protein